LSADGQRRRKGSVAVEFAFVAPVLILLLLGILAFGFQFAASIAATQAASEGARAAVGGLDDAERRTLGRDAALAVLTSYGGLAAPPRGTVPVPVVTATTVTVTVAIDLSGFGINALPLIGSILPLPTSASATVTTRIGSF
jgi:Flp pilus assembly protein TadG